MAQVTIELPTLLQQVVHAQSSVQVRARTLRSALDALIADWPALHVHLFDESGQLRQHVLCLYNGANSRWMETMEIPVHDGDTITIMQAVTGG